MNKLPNGRCFSVSQLMVHGLISVCTLQYRFLRPQGHKTFFILISAEHEILDAHKYKKNIKKFSYFQAQLSLK